MARPATIRDATIIEAARAVFLARGIRATTAEVAERAGVSEGSIFKRFRSKIELFEAAMGSPDEDPDYIRRLPSRVGRGDMRASLGELGRDIEAHLRTVIPLVMMSWSNPGPDGTPARLSSPHPAPLRILEALVDYFRAEMEEGRMRRLDPEVVARAFVGAIHHFVLFDVLFRGQRSEPSLASEEYLGSLVDLAWRGIAPKKSCDEEGEAGVRSCE